METRDKLFTEKQYLDQLTKYSRRSRQLENSIDELLKAEKEHVQLYSIPNREVLNNKYNTLFGCKLNSFVTKYSMGEDVVKLRSDYDDLVKILKDNWTITGGYVQMLWMLSIGIMLDTDERNMRILSNMIDNENVSDALYDFLIKYRLTDWERCSDTVLFPVPYQSTLSIISNNNQSKELTLQRLEKYLKKPIFTEDFTEKDLKPGNSIGLAWTSLGGATLTIESIKVSEKKDSGNIQVTGQLGDVMSESVEIAYSYVKSVAKDYGVPENYFNDAMIHLHIPEGATPKDGPSAGITMATALLSLSMNKVIRNDTAMTGELSLNGKVLPIGGLKEKTIAAKRLGFIKHIIIPYENIRDLDEIPENVKKGLTFHPVKDVKEVFDFMFKLNKLNKSNKSENKKQIKKQTKK